MALDFTKRAQLDEAMDEVDSYAEYRQCLHDLDSVSRLVLAHRATLAFLDRIAEANRGRVLSILDVACGDGSMLRRVARWADRRRVRVELIGIDLNPWAIQVAREFRQTGTPVEYIVSDVFAYSPERLPDVILTAHFTHHLTDGNLIMFLQWMERTAQLGWFVNDLHRHPNPYRLFRVLGAVSQWHPIVISDGLISIRRAFVVADWFRLLEAASVTGADVEQTFPARVVVSRIRETAQAESKLN